ncbi:ribosome hibernation-promoting factor, HPF/YfiA family [Rothia kristinae]|uniref:ribosome hibernation-promoting factor, HPF/YfiA family n=1 Tax=Rothia kristinae TaxID=37923 RepID=UPI0011A7614B|nr:ribosome-associated translation inhibitor RaiA [Rothia kristinae]
MTMDVSYIARNIRLPESFRDHVVERTERLQQLAEGADRLEVRVTRESHHKHSDEAVRVELTVRGPRDVVRAEAAADDELAAFDKAAARLTERLRRMRDRRKDRRRGKLGASRGAGEVGFVPPLPPSGAAPAAEDASAQDAPEAGTPVRIRQKAFPATPMSVDDAVDAMELVGHDFYLFQNAETGVPSVVYRRRDWSYGVIRLDESLPQDHVSASEGEQAYQTRED